MTACINATSGNDSTPIDIKVPFNLNTRHGFLASSWCFDCVMSSFGNVCSIFTTLSVNLSIDFVSKEAICHCTNKNIEAVNMLHSNWTFIRRGQRNLHGYIMIQPFAFVQVHGLCWFSIDAGMGFLYRHLSILGNLSI